MDALLSQAITDDNVSEGSQGKEKLKTSRDQTEPGVRRKGLRKRAIDGSEGAGVVEQNEPKLSSPKQCVAHKQRGYIRGRKHIVHWSRRSVNRYLLHIKAGRRGGD